MAGVEAALTEVLINHSDAVATALMRWLVTGARPDRIASTDFGWPPLGASYPFP
ncbi:MAG: hypothetical protein QOJ80_1746 [Mycobacterium sp.]|jgi:hypothetical protein|nr:hypothetical protein [Mycobacterium sp.]